MGSTRNCRHVEHTCRSLCCSYLTVVVGDSTYMTHTVLNNLSPEWHERCTLLVRCLGGGEGRVAPCLLGSCGWCLFQPCPGPGLLPLVLRLPTSGHHIACRDPAAQSVTVRVMGEDGSTTDDYLGSAAADLGPLCDGQEHRLQLDLKGSEFAGGGDEDGRGSSSGGSVHLTCHFLPFEEVLAGDAVLEIEGQPLLAKPGEVGQLGWWQAAELVAGCQRPAWVLF